MQDAIIKNSSFMLHYLINSSLSYCFQIVALGFEIYDTNELSKKGDTAEEEERILQRKYRSIHPTPLHIIQYCYCYIGLFTGNSSP